MVSIESGDEHSCAVLDNGSASCWGANLFGQLGTLTFRSTRGCQQLFGLP
ncbi:MAG: RCC1 domain-containing protein [Lentisphaeria bacterium]|nr:RCC1 domain-containing protein [Lentisphaeria bacterium]